MDMNLRIREYIKSNGMTFTHVANRAGIDFQKFTRMMSGKQKMDIDDYEKICKALSVRTDYFLTKVS